MNINLPDIAVDLLLNIINIIILFLIVKFLAYKPVKKFLDARAARIKEETGRAQKLVDEANETLSQKEALFEEGRRQGEAAAAEIHKKAQEKAEAIVKDAKDDAARIKEKAQSELSVQKENMLKSSKDEIAELSVKIAEKILEREVNEEDNRHIVEEFFKEV